MRKEVIYPVVLLGELRVTVCNHHNLFCEIEFRCDIMYGNRRFDNLVLLRLILWRDERGFSKFKEEWCPHGALAHLKAVSAVREEVRKKLRSSLAMYDERTLPAWGARAYDVSLVSFSPSVSAVREASHLLKELDERSSTDADTAREITRLLGHLPVTEIPFGKREV